jgi:hypothetical protein
MYLSVFLTNRCTAACAHCCVGSGPDRVERLDPDLIETTIERLNRTGALQGINLVGGEPTLARVALDRTLAVAARLGLRTQLVTNCAFARNAEQARDVIGRLRNGGLQHLHLSYDDYHAPFVPIDRLAHAWRAAKRLDFRSVIVIGARRRDATFGRDAVERALGEALPNFCKDALSAAAGTYYAYADIPTQRVGRGAIEVEESDLEPLRNGLSLQDLFRQRCPSALQEPALSARGRLVACGGAELDGNMFLDFGAVRDQDPVQLMAAAMRRPVAQAIATFGPGFLMKLAEKRQRIPSRADYRGICEICQDVTNLPYYREAVVQNLPIIRAALARRAAMVAGQAVAG